MNMTDKKEVVVIGSGVAGLSAAGELARFGHGVTLIEKALFTGGHAARFACKATDECVKCGACVVEEKLSAAVSHPDIRILTGSRPEGVEKNGRFAIRVGKEPEYMDPEKCTGCGACMDVCPEGAICRGSSPSHKPFYSIDGEKCIFARDGSCTLCRDACPEDAIRLEAEKTEESLKADAIIMATGFQAFNPVNKPYGYGRFPNVITNLDLEQMLRNKGGAARVSDDALPDRIAFIQCVGSRDASLGHGWCSRVCCASALRMARRIKENRPETEITVFYIDVQTFGCKFDQFYNQAQEDFRFVRSIPGDIYPEPNDRLKLNFYDADTQKDVEDVFDLVVLSVGITPGRDNAQLAGLLNLQMEDTGFLAPDQPDEGIFVAGTAHGPMNIMESVASGGDAAWKTIDWLDRM